MNHAIIVGAGIGGLTAAIALADVGWRVTLLERAASLVEAGAGLQLSPNATRVLASLDLLGPLTVQALAPLALRIRRGLDGAVLARMPFGETAERRWQGSTYVVHRADLQRGLLDAIAARPAITLRLNAILAGFEETGGGIRAKIGSDSLTGDLLIGADGLRSIVRTILFGGLPDPLVSAHRMAWRALIPAASVPDLFRLAETNLWLAPRSHLVHYPLRGGSVVNVVGIVEDMASSTQEAGWNAPGDATIIGRHFAGWTRAVRALIAAAPDWRVWPLYDRPFLAHWSKGHATLLGDAAHPMLPFLAQGASQAIEDAAALASAVAASPDDPVAALREYEAIRAKRAGAIQNQSRRQGRIYHLSGLTALARDLAIQTLGADRLMAQYDWVYGRKA